MKIKDFKLDEVAMNPSAFAQAIEEGSSKGVLVGYEFEVCVPKATIKKNKQEAVIDYKKEIDKAISDIIENSLHLAYEQGHSTKQFSSLFKPKGTKYKTVIEALKAFKKWRKAQFKELDKLVPADVRKAYEKKYKWQTDESGDLAEYYAYFASFIRTASYESKAKTGKKISKTLLDLADRFADLRDDIYVTPLLRFMFKGDELIEKAPNEAQYTVESDLDRYFDYDEKAVYNKLVLPLIETDDDYHEYDYNGAVRVLKPALEKTFGVQVNVFSEYHEARKNLTDWYVEPDGSLEVNNDGDGAGEVVTPPLNAIKAIEALKGFYAIAKDKSLYTNKSTGIHINVSIPEQIDVLKLAVFLGDQYVLKAFGREANSFARSSINILKRELKDGPKGLITHKKLAKKAGNVSLINLKKLLAIAKESTNQHETSISNNGKYISFRHAGGDYLADYTKIAHTVGRFIRAMVIAADSQAYRKEYLTKLYKMLPQELYAKPAAGKAANTESAKYKRDVVDKIRAGEFKALKIHIWNSKGKVSTNKAIKVARDLAEEETYGTPVRTFSTIKDTGSSAEARQKFIEISKLTGRGLENNIKKSASNKFTTIVLVPNVAKTHLGIKFDLTSYISNDILIPYGSDGVAVTVETVPLPVSTPEGMNEYKRAARAYFALVKKEAKEAKKK